MKLAHLESCAEYLKTEGLTLKAGTVTETTQPWDKGTDCYKYNATLVNSVGKKAKLCLYGSKYEYQHNDPSSAWDLISCSFADAMCYIDHKDIDDFAADLCIEKPSEAIKLYNACKRMWENLLSLGLSYDDIVRIEERASEGERK